jgi:O-antigen/teichoic acid export membrane protein
MKIDNNEYTNLSIAEKETLKHQSIAHPPLFEPVAPRPLKKTRLERLERLPLSEATTAMMRVVNYVSTPPLDAETAPELKARVIPGSATETSSSQVSQQKGLQAIYQQIMTDPLYRNSIFNMASTFILGGLGFVFWIIIARLYKPENVGIATTLISIMTLLSSFTGLGLNSSLNRYLPKSTNKNDLINSSFVIVTVATVLTSAIFLLGLQMFSPQLLFLRSNIFYIASFIIFITFCSWNILVESVSMAFRAAGNILIKNTTISLLKLVLPFAFIALGSYGIFASTASALSLGVLAGLLTLIFKFKIRPSLTVNTSLIKETLAYSFANYINGFMFNMPSLVLPVIILNVLSAKYAAYYYIASMIQNILLIIPLATAQSLLTEGSYNEAGLNKHIKKALTTILIILVPATAIIVCFGNLLLQFFGKSYATEAFGFLQLYSASTIFTALLLVANATMNIKHQIKLLVISNIGASILTLALSYAFISGKLIGIGWGWTIGQAIAGLLSLGIVIYNSSGVSERRQRRASRTWSSS